MNRDKKTEFDKSKENSHPSNNDTHTNKLWKCTEPFLSLGSQWTMKYVDDCALRLLPEMKRFQEGIGVTHFRSRGFLRSELYREVVHKYFFSNVLLMYIKVDTEAIA
ncbi:unnamed protein product [Orchesella dallaii]|uniref:Uncharacterized protein n=1 Tax=Orchesella dallaii TaxID=48710 RepID=A0ABP1QAR5_9HEXA